MARSVAATRGSHVEVWQGVWQEVATTLPRFLLVNVAGTCHTVAATVLAMVGVHFLLQSIWF